MLSLDTETTGLDLRHGAKPFIITLCDEQGDNSYWEFDVNPFTRQPYIHKTLEQELRSLIEGEDLVLQNPKFDVAALASIGLYVDSWPWHRTFDTLLAGHLLASNQPHDLTTMALIYLGVNIQPYEDHMKEACQEARRIAKRDFTEWKLAKEGLPDMPSVKGSGKDEGKPWKNDMWLPKALATVLEYPKDHPWYTVTLDYANADSSVTLPLFKVMKEELQKRKLWKIYLERLKVLPVISRMESRGVTLNRERTLKLQEKFREESDICFDNCVEASDNTIEELPVNGVSNALKEVVYNKFKLESPKFTAKGNPSMDKHVLDHWIATLPETSPAFVFVKNLKTYRKKQTAIGYINSYQKFWLPLRNKTNVLYPSVNPTGTDTLRMSSSNPNEQQISKQEEANLRYCYGPAEDREWWSCDAKNIELRLPAYEAGETAMIELFERPNDPPYFGSNHLLFFDILHPDKWDRNDPEGLLKAKKKYASTWYQWTKNGDFAVQYGAMAESGTADAAYHVPGGQAKIESRLSNIKKLSERMIQHAKKHGYVETMPDRTVDPDRGYPLLCTRSKWGDILPTVPLSYHVQGTAMWWMMKAMIRCHEYLEELNQEVLKKGQDVQRKGYFIMMQIHDELVFDFPRGTGAQPWNTNLPKIRRIMRLMAEGGNDIGVPTPVSCEYHPVTWAEGVSL